jgi:hypothetical protein
MLVVYIKKYFKKSEVAKMNMKFENMDCLTFNAKASRIFIVYKGFMRSGNHNGNYQDRVESQIYDGDFKVYTNGEEYFIIETIMGGLKKDKEICICRAMFVKENIVGIKIEYDVSVADKLPEVVKAFDNPDNISDPIKSSLGIKCKEVKRVCATCLYSAKDDCDKASNYYFQLKAGTILECKDWEEDLHA